MSAERRGGGYSLEFHVSVSLGLQFLQNVSELETLKNAAVLNLFWKKAWHKQIDSSVSVLPEADVICVTTGRYLKMLFYAVGQ